MPSFGDKFNARRNSASAAEAAAMMFGDDFVVVSTSVLKALLEEWKELKLGHEKGDA